MIALLRPLPAAFAVALIAATPASADEAGISTRIFRKRDGKWVIALNHVSARETPPGALK